MSFGVGVVVRRKNLVAALLAELGVEENERVGAL